MCPQFEEPHSSCPSLFAFRDDQIDQELLLIDLHTRLSDKPDRIYLD